MESDKDVKLYTPDNCSDSAIDSCSDIDDILEDMDDGTPMTSLFDEYALTDDDLLHSVLENIDQTDQADTGEQTEPAAGTASSEVSNDDKHASTICRLRSVVRARLVQRGQQPDDVTHMTSSQPRITKVTRLIYTIQVLWQSHMLPASCSL